MRVEMRKKREEEQLREAMCEMSDAAKSEKEAQACAPGKSMEELEAMYNDCQGSDDSNESKDGDDMKTKRMDMDMDMRNEHGHGYGMQKCRQDMDRTWIWTCQKCQTGYGHGYARNAKRSNIGSIYLVQ